MAVRNLIVEEFLFLAKMRPVLDVRSPSEYAHAHIPGAVSFPIFNDAERAEIGTAYKQRNREDAIKIGLTSFGPRMKEMVENAEKISAKSSGEILVHCWRGGMRSGAVAWLLDLYGYNVCVLKGGYKAYRTQVLVSFEKTYPFVIVGGNTGSGKTLTLHELKKKGFPVLDLEGIACHKGSAFGSIPGVEQPGQEQFENNLNHALREFDFLPKEQSIFVEDESQRIGSVNLPASIYQSVRNGKQFYLDIPFEARLDFILEDYQSIKAPELVASIMRIKKRLGPLETKSAINFLLEEEKRNCFKILLEYYDKHYGKSMLARAIPLHKIPAETVTPIANAAKIIQSLNEENERT
ncbi:MAG: tRNA 2-selenouridine(34) synthase MnmH [Chitinophagaceae bacterium]